MKRDMELCRKILLAIEEQYVDTALYGLEVEGYSMQQVAYHCKILHDARLISDYKGHFASNELLDFGVGCLTWEGHEFLDKIREDTVWNKTKDVITQKGLPMVLDVVKEISQSIVATMVQGAIKGLSQ